MKVKTQKFKVKTVRGPMTLTAKCFYASDMKKPDRFTVGLSKSSKVIVIRRTTDKEKIVFTDDSTMKAPKNFWVAEIEGREAEVGVISIDPKPEAVYKEALLEQWSIEV